MDEIGLLLAKNGRSDPKRNERLKHITPAPLVRWHIHQGFAVSFHIYRRFDRSSTVVASILVDIQSNCCGNFGRYGTNF